jgi:hypothetical protein
MAAGYGGRILEGLMAHNDALAAATVLLLTLASPGAAAPGPLRSVTAAAVGEADTHLLFVPLAPCRAFDTRLMTDGDLAAGEVRSFKLAGTLNFTTQGGKSGGCGVPTATPPIAGAVAINLVAVGPTGPGHLVAWEFGQPTPTASALNYSNVAGLNLANSVILPITATGSAAADISIQAAVSSTHVLGDVTGYFIEFPLAEATSGSLAVAREFPSAASCSELLSCSVTSKVAGTVVVHADVELDIDHVNGTEDRFRASLQTFASCTAPFYVVEIVRAGTATDADVGVNASLHGVFSQDAGDTVEYQLWGMLEAGDTGSPDRVTRATIICTFTAG